MQDDSVTYDSFVSFADNATCQSVEMYSIDGRLVKSQKQDFDAIDVSCLPAGIYMLKARMADGKELVEKIVKR